MKKINKLPKRIPRRQLQETYKENRDNFNFLDQELESYERENAGRNRPGDVDGEATG